jgi:ATP-dependent Clp protease ATP-binding subunit ClpA
MMFERFTGEARLIVVRAQDDARRLGHDYIGCEHLLLAAAAADAPAAEVLRAQGVTPERIQAELVRVTGRDAGADPARGVDRDALAAIGIDLDVVQARIEASFGPDPGSAHDQGRHAEDDPGRPGRLG